MGEFFALLTAAFWAGAVILFKRSGEELPPLLLNALRVSVSSVLLLLTMAAVRQPPWRPAPLQDFLLIAASGVIAIAVADTLFHASLNRIGAGLTAIVDCLYPPLTAFFALLLLGEVLSGPDYVGMALVVGAVLVVSQAKPPGGVTRRTLLAGIGLGVLGMAALSLGIVIVKPVLRHQPVIWVTGMRQFVALAILVPAVLISPAGRRDLRRLRLSRPLLRYALPGTVLGSYLSLICWIAGMKFITAGTAAVLNQTATIYIILLARIVLQEPLTRRRLAACLMALGGVLCIVLT
ncbi:MAG: DMT family transporter [Candidatus Krumholzibacteria bacterium]|jgi:drug/metabolite transporter (DMT)-like permease|nr:DMT family transporter [Candidatus Krumholzibacteria bacterium]